MLADGVLRPTSRADVLWWTWIGGCGMAETAVAGDGRCSDKLPERGGERNLPATVMSIPDCAGPTMRLRMDPTH